MVMICIGKIRPVLGEKTLGVNGSKIRSVIFVIIESGVTMFAIQLIRVLLTILGNNAVHFIIGASQMFNVTMSLMIISYYYITDNCI